jgi:hypothetical protein
MVSFIKEELPGALQLPETDFPGSGLSQEAAVRLISRPR